MSKQVLNLKKGKKSLVGKKEIIVIVFAVLLTTLGIKASDSLLEKKDTEMGKNGFCEIGMTHIPFAKGDFCIDMYEVSAGEDCSYAEPSNQTDSRINLDDPNCVPTSAKASMPWRNISQDQAKRACAKAGKRLATNEEWLQAALGTPDINDGWQTIDCQVNNNWEEQPGATGSARSCVSSFGAYDMIGNVWEWVDAVVEEGLLDGKVLPSAGFISTTNGKGIPDQTDATTPNPDYGDDYFWLKTKGVRGMVRGGYWNSKTDAGVYALYAVAPPSSVESGIGFRCVK